MNNSFTQPITQHPSCIAGVQRFVPIKFYAPRNIAGVLLIAFIFSIAILFSPSSGTFVSDQSQVGISCKGILVSPAQVRYTESGTAPGTLVFRTIHPEWISNRFTFLINEIKLISLKGFFTNTYLRNVYYVFTSIHAP
ncbi:MAG: hypothetical protein HRU69_15285 [Flammeovirgaceae bacterium]|nr:MAG: hypothetical protein HRU69_15285 [Flammeovirgaceae bacterium]